MENFTDEQIMNSGVGNKEAQSLKPAKVKILEAVIEKVGEDKKLSKVVCTVKHPDKEEPIKLSSIKINKNDVLKELGLFINMDEDGQIQKGSGVALLLEQAKAKNIIDLKDKEIDTISGSKGYLVFKAF